MYDITRPHSLRNIDEWIEIYNQQQIKKYQAPLIIVGGKSDLTNRRLVPEKDVKKIAKSHRISHYFTTSAKTGENIEITFDTLTRAIMKKTGLL